MFGDQPLINLKFKMQNSKLQSKVKNFGIIILNKSSKTLNYKLQLCLSRLA
jgi:hypothetical protein